MNLPPYDSFPVISSGNITLREIQRTDLADLLEISFYDAVKASDLLEAEGMQQKIDEDYRHGNSIHWGIVDNVSNSIVGTCGYYRGLDKGAGELGCVLLPHYQGKGFMTAALQLAIVYGLKNIGLDRIWAITTMENQPARKLLDKLGFIIAGELPDNEIEYIFRQENEQS